jgi:transcriptional regulator with XRE-family HTH domain
MTPFKELRLRAGLSAKKAAKILGVHPQSIRRYEIENSPSSRKPSALTIKEMERHVRNMR